MQIVSLTHYQIVCTSFQIYGIWNKPFIRIIIVRVFCFPDNIFWFVQQTYKYSLIQKNSISYDSRQAAPAWENNKTFSPWLVCARRFFICFYNRTLFRNRYRHFIVSVFSVHMYGCSANCFRLLRQIYLPWIFELHCSVRVSCPCSSTAPNKKVRFSSAYGLRTKLAFCRLCPQSVRPYSRSRYNGGLFC